MPLVLGGSSVVAEPYSVDYSCRFDKASSAFLNLTFATPTNGHIWNFSCWVKRTNLGTGTPLWNPLFCDAGSPDCRLYFRDDDWRFDGYHSGGAYAFQTTQLFRDVSAWYHVCILWDDTQATPADRAKLFINGTQVTAFAVDDPPDQDSQHSMNTAIEHYIGRIVASQYTDCYMAQVCFIDGTVYTVSDFGEFNSDSPTVWQPIDVSELTFGNNGFLLDFADSSDFGNDVSGKGNDWASNGLVAADQSTDTPTNNFCTLNPVATTNGLGAEITFTEANCFMANTGSGLWEPAIGTLAAKGGKWYGEVKCVALGSGNNIGIMSPAQYNDNMSLDNPATATLAYGMNYSTGAATNGPGNWTTSWGEAYTSGDIISVAMDLDNMKLYFAKNGVWVASGDPTSGATGTGTQTWFGGSGDTTNAAGVDYYTFFAAFHNSSTTATNFGGSSGFAITSANQDANGYGNFEYAVPTGYYALCTKNLAEFGG